MADPRRRCAPRSAPARHRRARQYRSAESPANEQAAAARKAKQTAVYKECKAVVGPLDDRLTELDSRLGVCVPFAKYSDLVGQAQVAYDKLLGKTQSLWAKAGKSVDKADTALRALQPSS